MRVDCIHVEVLLTTSPRIRLWARPCSPAIIFFSKFSPFLIGLNVYANSS